MDEQVFKCFVRQISNSLKKKYSLQFPIFIIMATLMGRPCDLQSCFFKGGRKWCAKILTLYKSIQFTSTYDLQASIIQIFSKLMSQSLIFVYVLFCFSYLILKRILPIPIFLLRFYEPGVI